MSFLDLVWQRQCAAEAQGLPQELQVCTLCQLVWWVVLEQAGCFLTQLISRKLPEHRQVCEQPVQLCRVWLARQHLLPGSLQCHQLAVSIPISAEQTYCLVHGIVRYSQSKAYSDAMELSGMHNLNC